MGSMGSKASPAMVTGGVVEHGGVHGSCSHTSMDASVLCYCWVVCLFGKALIAPYILVLEYL